jgi:hypothetical protein
VIGVSSEVQWLIRSEAGSDLSISLIVPTLLRTQAVNTLSAPGIVA